MHNYRGRKILISCCFGAITERILWGVCNKSSENVLPLLEIFISAPGMINLSWCSFVRIELLKSSFGKASGILLGKGKTDNGGGLYNVKYVYK